MSSWASCDHIWGYNWLQLVIYDGYGTIHGCHVQWSSQKGLEVMLEEQRLCTILPQLHCNGGTLHWTIIYFNELVPSPLLLICDFNCRSLAILWIMICRTQIAYFCWLLTGSCSRYCYFVQQRISYLMFDWLFPRSHRSRPPSRSEVWWVRLLRGECRNIYL